MTGEALVELVLAEHAERARRAEPPPRRLHGVVIGVLHGLGPAREALVDFPGNPGEEPRPARSTVPLEPDAIGRAAARMFEEGDPEKPLLLGLIHALEPDLIEAGEVPAEAASPAQELAVDADGERVQVRADNELVLRCGKASSTPTAAGKDPDPRGLRAHPLLGGEPDPGWLGADQLIPVPRRLVPPFDAARPAPAKRRPRRNLARTARLF